MDKKIRENLCYRCSVIRVQKCFESRNMENRTFIPGSEWIYFKIYTGTKTADAILKNELYGFVSEMLKNKVIDKWFFIRYNDPDFHIRLRIHLKEKRFLLRFQHFL